MSPAIEISAPSTANLRAMNSRRPNSVLLLAGLLVGAVGFWPACGSAGDERLNVLLITLDTTRADHLSCYGYPKLTTPRIDALAQEGVLFERCISTAGITPMSHASILTGLNNYNHGIRVFYSEEASNSLGADVRTLPELLAARGYQTAAQISSYPVSEAYGLNRGFDYFGFGVDLSGADLTQQQKHETSWLDGEKSNTQRRGDYSTTDAIAWLDSNADNGAWCMWLHLFDVHDFSLVPPLDFSQKHGIPAYDTSVKTYDAKWRDRMYDPELAFVDQQVGRLVDWLKAHDEFDNTIIIVTADHGQGLLDGGRNHGWGKHRLLYDWSLHVPLVLRIPGERMGRKIRDQVRTIDILPTILEAADVPGPQMDGASLLGLIRGEQEAEPRMAYAEALNMIDEHSPKGKLPPADRDNLFCVSDGRWKLIYHHTAGKERVRRHQLFDLEEDPRELKNVARLHSEELQRLKKILQLSEPWNVPKPGAENVLSEEERKARTAALKGVGYYGEDEQDSDKGSEEEEPPGSSQEARDESEDGTRAAHGQN